MDEFDSCSICQVHHVKSHPPRKCRGETPDSKSVDPPDAVEHPSSSATDTPFVVSQDAFAQAVSVCGMSTNMALDFAAALEMTTNYDGKPLKLAPGLKDATYALNKIFEPFTKLVNLQRGERAAVVVNDWEGYYQTDCRKAGKCPEDLVSSTRSADHGGTSLKATVSFKWRSTEKPAKKRAAPACLQKLKRVGVRKFYVVALVSGVHETYHAMQSGLAVLSLTDLKAVLEKYSAELSRLCE